MVISLPLSGVLFALSVTPHMLNVRCSREESTNPHQPSREVCADCSEPTVFSREAAAGLAQTEAPTYFAASTATQVMPMLLWRHNSMFGMWYKLLAETPPVPLILIQCTLRAAVLSAAVADAHDKEYFALEAAQEWALLLQVFTFIFMDTMTRPAPKLRTFFAIILLVRFLSSFYYRALEGAYIPSEQYPWLPQDGVFAGFGTGTRQSLVASIDWTVVAMIASSCWSVFLHPRELAFVRLRCDVLSYINWRDHFVRRMMVRGRRRHEDLEDAILVTKEAWKARLRGKPKHSGLAASSTEKPSSVVSV